MSRYSRSEESLEDLRAKSWHDYNGLSISAFAKQASVTPREIKELIERGWFNFDGERPEVFDRQFNPAHPQWSLNPGALPRLELARKVWALQDMRKRTVERWTQGVYVVRTEEGRTCYKIGYASDFTKRLCGLRGMSPVALSPVAWIAGADMSTEARLHKVFRRVRLHGEWFSESPALLWLIAKYRYSEPSK